MEGQIDNRVKADRLNRVNALQSRLAREINEKYVGSEVEILVDGTAPRGENALQGRTKTDKVVIVKGPREMMGKYIRVKIVRASHWSLEGEII
jgi:tRNA-2-methylthio-N6-dimethylallyladenosine synthase